MKSMFLDEEQMFCYGNGANDLNLETYNKLKKIFDKYTKKGFSPRDISHVLIHSIIELETGYLIGLMIKKYEKKENQRMVK